MNLRTRGSAARKKSMPWLVIHEAEFPISRRTSAIGYGNGCG